MTIQRQDPKCCELLIINACVLTVDEGRQVFACGAVAVEGSQIVAVGRSVDLEEQYRTQRVIDAEGAIVHPGFVEPHIHISQYHSRPATAVFQIPDAPFRYPSWKANLQPEDEYPSTQLGCIELLRAGFTSFVEPGTAFSPDTVASAAAAVGLRGWVTDAYLWDNSETLKIFPALISDELLERVPCNTDRCLGALGGELYRNRDSEALIKGHVAVYGEATATDELRTAAKACAREHDVTYTEHLCFAPAINDAEKARLGCSQVTKAHELGLLDEATTAVHMNMLEDEDEAVIVDSGMSIVWCAANYLAVAAQSGIRTRLPTLCRHGANVTIGIDTPATTNPGDTPTIANLAAREAGDLMRATELLEMQTVAAAKSIGAEKDIGSIEVGKRADLVIRQPTAGTGSGFDPIYELIFYHRASNVRCVVVNGELVLDEGLVVGVDESAVAHAAAESCRHIIERIGMTPVHGWPVVE